jgi:hypothetical protein
MLNTRDGPLTHRIEEPSRLSESRIPVFHQIQTLVEYVSELFAK